MCQRFRDVRSNLKRSPHIAQAYASGAVTVESIADLSAFAPRKVEGPLAQPHASALNAANESEDQYRYRNGMWLALQVDE